MAGKIPDFLLRGVVAQHARGAGPVVVKGFTRGSGVRVGTFIRKRPTPGMGKTYSAARRGGPSTAHDFVYGGSRRTKYVGAVKFYSAQRVSSLGHRSIGLKFDAYEVTSGRANFSGRTHAYTNRTGGGPGGLTGGRAYYNVTLPSQRRIRSLASRMRVAAGGRPFV